MRSTCVYASRVVDPLFENIDAARALLDLPMPESEVELTEVLTRVQEHITAALDETMARAALGGASMRTIASYAQVAPNSVPPRLARSAALAAYAESGKVTAEALAVARADQKRFTFTPRRRTT